MSWKAWTIACVFFAASGLLADKIFTRDILFRSSYSDCGRIQHLYQENEDEIPIFGSSKVHGFCSPADMGLNAFNYGMDSASYEVTDVFLQIELTKPKTTPIIIELQHEDTGSLGDQSKFIPFVSDPRFQHLLKRFGAMKWRYFIPGIRYFGYYDWFFKDYLNERMGVLKVDKGFIELVHQPPFDRAKLDRLVRERLQLTTGYFPNEDQNHRLIGHIIKNPQRLFFLIVSPYHPSYYAHFQNEEKFHEFEAQLAALPNVVVIDWSRMPYPDESFLDTLHMRREADADFSRKLGDKIRQVLRE
jgi:hypothetical protein